MTDIELSQTINNIIADEYITAVEFIEVNPDHTLVLFRHILSHICNAIGNMHKIEFMDDTPYKQINQLYKEKIINSEFRDLLHKARKQGNTGAHKTYDPTESEEEFIRNSKKKLLNNAKDTRYLIVDIFITTIQILNNRSVNLEDIAFVTFGDQEYKQILLDATLYNTPDIKLKAGLLYESMAKTEFEKNIFYTRLDALYHMQSLYKSAAACYEVGYKASCNVEQKMLETLKMSTPDIADEIIYRDCDLEPLFRYAVILSENSDGSNQEEMGYKYLKIASDRGHPEATAHYAIYLYNLEDYDLAFKYLQRDNVQDIALTHRVLCHYYGDGYAPFTDKSLALLHIKKAIELNCSRSLGILGEAYHTGSFVDKDDVLAEKFLLKAIEAGDAQARKYHLLVFQKGAEKIAKSINSIFKDISAKASITQAVLGLERKKHPRNKPCPCGSGKKYKHCCV